jgi:hypothetical protein
MNPDQHRVLIARMLRKIRSDAIRFPFLLADLRQQIIATPVCMTLHDSDSAEAAINLIQHYHTIITGYSPFKEPLFCPEYQDWIGTASAIARYGGWRERGLRSAFGYCVQALSLQNAVLWHLGSVSSCSIEEFLNRGEGIWLSYIFAIPDPVDYDDSD